MANRGTRPVILVVDDEVRARALFKETLEAVGYECLLAANGDEALAILARERIDLALLDIIMPGMSSTELFLRMQRQHPRVAVVFVTAVSDANLAADALKAGAYDFITKPMRFQELGAVVQKALERRQAEEADRVGNERLRQTAESWTTEADRRIREVAGLNQALQGYVDQRARVVELAQRMATAAEHAADEMRRLAEEVRSLAQGIATDTESPRPPRNV
jgi:two-component system response regulator HydG